MRYVKTAALAGVATVAIGLLILWATQPKPVALTARQTFDTSEEGWFGYGGGHVRVTTDKQHVKQGTGALELEYTPGPGQFGSAVVLVSDGSLAELRRLRFWIKTDDDTAAAVVLSERRPNGGDYSAWFWSPKQRWQHIELFPEDFALNEGPADAKDANGRLDVAELQGVGFIDLGQFFGLISADRAYPLFLKTTTGTHYIHVDDFEILRDQTASGTRSSRIGDPSRGFVSWITLGGATLSLSKPGNPLGQAGYEVNYEQAPVKSVAIVHGLSNLDLTVPRSWASTSLLSGPRPSPCTWRSAIQGMTWVHATGPRWKSPPVLLPPARPLRSRTLCTIQLVQRSRRSPHARQAEVYFDD